MSESKTIKATGSTEEGLSKFLPASFFRKGVTLAGKVVRIGENENGRHCVIALLKPVEVDGEEHSMVSIGLSGFFLAYQATGYAPPLAKDTIAVECTGRRDTGKESEMVTFKVSLERSRGSEF